MNSNNFNDLLSVLDICDTSVSVSKVEIIDDVKYIYIQRDSVPTFCPICSSRMHSKGLYTRKINHPILQDSTKVFVILKQRKWYCPICRHFENERFTFVEQYKQSTNLTPLMIHQLSGAGAVQFDVHGSAV